MDNTEAASVIQRVLTCIDICRDECYGHCETCRYNAEYDEETEALKLAIKALEGKDTNVPTKWIPVTPETMPPDDEEVEVTILDDSGDSPFRYTTVGWHYNGLWIANNERCFDVVAWKPLPEPWEGDTK